MNIGEFLASINRFDLLVVLFLFGMFVLGFIQGTIRRILGLASMLFSLLFASNLREPLGNFLAANWTQFPAEYAVMIGYGTVFVAATIAFTLVIQGFYHKQSLFEKATFVDELIGGTLGIVQGMFLLMAMVMILDTFFRIPTIVEGPNELPVLRGLFELYDGSGTAELLRSRIIPGFIGVFGLLIPAEIQRFFVARG